MRVPGVRFVQGRNAHGTSTKYAVAIHATANTAPADGEAGYATRRTDGIGAHLYADAIEVIQSLDTNASTWHAGNQGNTLAIAVEITGLNSWSRAKWLASVAWDKLGAALAAVSRAHDIPAARLTVAQMQANDHARGAYDHNQMRLAWGGTDHTDPGPNFPWDHLLAVWQRHLNGEDDMVTDEDVTRIARAVVNQKLGKSTVTVGAALQSLAGRAVTDDTDEAAIIAGVLAGLDPAKIAAVIPADMAQRVADELAARLQG